MGLGTKERKRYLKSRYHEKVIASGEVGKQVGEMWKKMCKMTEKIMQNMSGCIKYTKKYCKSGVWHWKKFIKGI